MVPPRVTVITLGARDIERLRNFYKALGWSTAFEIEDDVTVFETDGAVLALFPLDKLAADGKTSVAACEDGLRGFSLAINVETPEQVDETITAVRETGGSVTKEPTQEEWGGRSAYFADPEENYWEVVWVPPDSKMAAVIKRAGGFGRKDTN